jgi:glycosyltransferase involved in cell wall biosynthesis
LKKDKKILIISECFYPEEFKINDLAFHWQELGYQVDVLTLVPTYPHGRVYKNYKNYLINNEIYQGINIIRIRAITGYVGSSSKKILKYINFMIIGSLVALKIGNRYDFVFGYNLGALTDMLPAVIIKKVYKKPLLIWVQDLWPDSIYAFGYKETKIISFFLNSFVKFIYKNVNNIAISSKGFKSKLSKYTKKNQIFHYAPNWADSLNLDGTSIKLSKEKKVHLTFAGNIGKVQNLENIVNSFNALPIEYQKKAQLNIIGDGSNLNLLKELSFKNQSINYFGKIPRENIAKYLKASDFLIISLASDDIFSLTVPAKMQTYIAAKKPIIGVIRGESANIIKENHLGFTVHPDDIVSITKVFEKSIDMLESEKRKFIKNNEELLINTFNQKMIIDKLTKILIE